MVETMQLVLIGVHQRSAPLAVRERLAFGAADLPAALAGLRERVDEGFIISTCNRVEICALVADAEQGRGSLLRYLGEWHGLDPADVARYAYSYAGEDAVRHVHRLAAGLDSMVLGEDQIVAQIKEALGAAQAAGAIGGAMHRLLHGALAAGKAVRTQTGIASGRLSVVSVAIDLARRTLGGLAGRRALVVGAGRMAELALKHLADEPGVVVTVANRTAARAQELAGRYGAAAVPLDWLEEALRASDVAITATAAPGVVIDAEIQQAEAIVDEAVARYMEWWSAQRAVPMIRALRERAEAIRRAELERTLARCPELSEREREAIQALSAAIVNKLLHGPITTIKATGANRELLQAARELFDLPADVA